MKVTVYPRNINRNDLRINPYIDDFIRTLEQSGIIIDNLPHKNPLFSLLPRKTDNDVYIFHWLENVPDYKYGMLQTIAAIWLILKIKSKHKKIVYFLHNKQPHIARHKYAKKLLIRLLLHKADLIVTHASEGMEVIRQQYKAAVPRAIFLHHPTKNQINDIPGQPSPKTDLLIWGNITRYKGILEFVRFATHNQLNLQIKIIGKCNSNELYEELKQYASKYIIIENRSIPFTEVAQEIQSSRFVLIPYAAETILSSGILMDSLSFGAKVIGPDVGSFRDYAHSTFINVYTFSTFKDIPAIVYNKDKAIDLKQYRDFLDEHSWENFGRTFYKELQNLIKQ